ncbi:hypothetical protein O3M35_007074 [Rhynocoris fuscipes]|uniref:Alpha 1,4-glycosyltransferase domain-containing protein n=1 Tax=Rhynocoris fuscipes TaxID=488301 RepID=A0AAW1DDR7_9HEMI
MQLKEIFLINKADMFPVKFRKSKGECKLMSLSRLNKRCRLLIIMLIIMLIILISHYRHLLHKPVELHLQKMPFVSDKNIFFIETSCIFNTKVRPGRLHLNTKQVCSIYSAAILNPTRSVILYHSCPLLQNYYEKSSNAVKQILKLPNVYIMNTKFETLVRDFLLKNISHDLKKSKLNRKYAPDILKLSLIHQFGGVFMDLNFISLRSLDSLDSNFIACESNEKFTSSIFQLDYKDIGSEFIETMMQDLEESYVSDKTITNLEDLITRNYFQYCNIPAVNCSKIAKGNYIGEYTSKKCGITVYNAKTFFPIDYRQWETLIDPQYAEQIWKNISDSITLYTWKYLANDVNIVKGEFSAYELIVKKYCSEVYDSIGEEF